MSEQFQHFFTELAQRFRNENDLSDFTYVALEAIPEFKKDFVRFFHPLLEIGDDEIQVIREFTLESTDEQPSGRPDFLLRCGSWDLIVENKIGDRNYHFDQYGIKPLLSGREKPHVGLIANHRVEPEPQAKDWAIKTWSEFIEHFEKKKYSDYNDVFLAYMEYVKKVCAMTEFKNFKFDFNSLYALTHFIRMIERALQTDSNNTYEISNISKGTKWDIGESWAGCCFELKSKSQASNAHLNLFFGIDFSKESGIPSIVADVHKSRNSNYFQAVVEQTTSSQFCEKKHWPKDGLVQLRMRMEKFNEINNESNKEKQLEKLKEYLNICCNAFLTATPKT